MFLEKTHDKYQGFVVTKALAIPELQCRLLELLHVPSGAMVMQIENEDTGTFVLPVVQDAAEKL